MKLFSDDSTNASLDTFFRNQPLSRQIIDVLLALIDEHGPCELAVTRSQVAFRRARPFAGAWRPGKKIMTFWAFSHDLRT